MSETIALGIMCKAPRPGVTKTRLARVLGPDRAAALSGCFLRDVAASIEAVPAHLGGRGYGVYAPAGTEAELQALLPEGSTCCCRRVGISALCSPGPCGR